ncbi:MAG TPA: T9SS type A sorting domain-containing protein [Lentimicrobium sp.]|nr:T9SS type A sorting domain-containing protein [Lentimicrobium sp.]
MKRKLYQLITLVSAFLVVFAFTTSVSAQIISQYVEAHLLSTPKGIEIWNNTSSTLNFATNNLQIQQGTNGGALTTLVTVNTGTLAPGAVMCVGTADIGTYLTDNGLTSVTFVQFTFQFNGDDALAVLYGGVTSDVFGNPGNDPGTSWVGGTVSTANQNLQILAGITTGDLDGWTDPSLRFETVSTTPSTPPTGLTGFGIPPASAGSPTLVANPSTLNGFNYAVNNGPSASQSYNLTGTSLSPASGNITVTPSANYEVSLNNSTFSSTAVTIPYTGGALAATPVYVRLKAGLSAGAYNGETISNAGGGATTVNVTLNGQVSNPATHLAFLNFPASGFTNQTISTFKVQALNANELVDPGFVGAITLSKLSGPGTVGGTLTQTAVAGEATFNDISFTDAGSYVLQATATGLTSANSSTIVIAVPPAISADIIPLYMSGKTPANTRVPFAFRATITNLTPNATYRYINQAVIATDGPTVAGAGVLLMVNADGTFTRSSLGNFANPGEFGEFTASATGSYTGWFMLEPSSNDRFTAGNEVFMRFRLNNGAGGTSAAHYLTIAEPVTVLQYATTTDPISGTAVRATSLSASKNFAVLYDNEAGTGRPLFATSIETTGIDYSAVTSYAAFYRDEVFAHNGAFGGIIPNDNPNGVKLIEERSLTSGAVVSSNSSSDGIWGLTDTRNPAYGIDSVLVIHLTPELIAETVPAFIQGVNGTNNQRLPYAYYATISYLKPNAIYRYYNKVVLGTDDPATDGSGNAIFVTASGTYTRTTSNSMNTPGQYGTFTADNMGNYSGWFMVEPTGDSRFTPGNDVHMRIMLNNGTGGSSVAVRITTTATASVLNFGSAYNDVTGTGIRGFSLAAAGNLVYLFGNEAGTGQPLAGTSIETTGVDYSQNIYADYFNTDVYGTDGSWGTIVPNVLPDGVRRIEERSVADGSIVTIWTSTDGVWSNVDTRNPLGGESTELVIDLMPTSDPTLTVIPSTLTGFTYIESNGPSASQSYTLSGANLVGSGVVDIVAPVDYEVSLDNTTFQSSIEVPYADGSITGQPVTINVRLKAGLAMGDYNNEVITNNGGGAPEATVSASGSVTTSALPGLTSVILPQYIEGLNGTNINRVPFAYYATLSYLTPNATYRYYNKIVVESDLPDFNGAGNTIFVNADGTFLRTTQTSLELPGQYGEFTTDATGSWSGWFITEPSGNDRFTPGNHVYMRINLNDGAEGTVVASRFTTEQYATVLQFGVDANPTMGTAIHAISNDSQGDFVFLYDGISDTLRPIYGTQIESTGIDFTAPGVYAPFYASSIAGVNGSWGGIVPNVNPNGIQVIKVMSNNDGSLINTYTQPSGIWLGTDTRNPTGGVDAVLFLDLKTISVSDVEKEIARIYSRGNEIVIEPVMNGSYNFSIINISGSVVASYSLSGNQTIPANLPAGVYVGRLQNGKGIYTVKLFIK